MSSFQPPFYNIRDFGARGDGQAKDTAAIQAAIDACGNAGGGVVLCPPGRYLTGSLLLRSNVNLHLTGGALILGSTEQVDYRSFDRGVQSNLLNDSPMHLIYAAGEENVAITGAGRIDGQGDAFFGPRKTGAHLSVKGWRPLQMLVFVDCKNVLVEGITLSNAPYWALWPLACDTVRITGLKILNNPWGPNTDGIDPDSCRNVHISDCTIIVGDDCIALKSDKAKTGGERACENITVTNCVLETTCCAIRVGYEGDSPIRNCTFSNIVVTNSRTGINMLVPRHAEVGIEHGPCIENIRFSDMVMDTRIPFYLWIADETRTPGAIRDVHVSRIRATTERGCYFGGSRTVPIENIAISDLDLHVRGPMDSEFWPQVPYPYQVWDYFDKRGVPHALYFRHARDVRLRDVRVDWKHASGDWRSALRCESVEDLAVRGLEARNGTVPAPVVHLTDTVGARFDGCRALAGAPVFLKTDGAKAGPVAVTNCDLSQVAR